MADKAHIIKFHAALSKAQLLENKPDILASYGVESTKDLTNRQIDDVLRRLNLPTSGKSKREPADEIVRRNRSTVLDLLTKMGVYHDSRSWDSVNNYLDDPRICGKRLYVLNVEELKQLQRKLRIILKKQEIEIAEAFNAPFNQKDDDDDDCVPAA